MAIINTFPKCLGSPYLFEDPAAPDRVGPLLALARERIGAAGDLVRAGQGESTDVALFSYEAMFASLRALVYRKGYREAGLRCLLLAVEALYVRPGLLDVALVHAFERAQGLKLPPAAAFAAAEALAGRASELLEGQAIGAGCRP